MSGRLLAALLRLAPTGFRRRYGGELLLVHRERRRETRGLRRLAFTASELLGLFRLVAQLRFAERRAQRSGQNRTRRGSMFDIACHHVRTSFRTLAGNPGFALASLGILGLGIGAATAIFAAVNASFFRPLPFADEERLAMLVETNPEFGWTDAAAAPANVLDWREQVAAFDDVAMVSEFVSRTTYLRDGEPELLASSAVSGNFFDVLGVRPAHGRGFTWEETWEGRNDVIVLSHDLWVSHFGADPSVVGKTVEGFSSPQTIVGVMPPGFHFPSDQTQLWTPWGWPPENRDKVFFRRAHWVRPIARLQRGISLEAAAVQLEVVVQRLQREYPATNSVMGARLLPLRAFLTRQVRTPLLVLLGAVSVLLLLTCVSVTNLALVRVGERRREVGVRLALGAGRGRVAGLVLTESLLLAAAGGAIGLGVAWLGLRAPVSGELLGIRGATRAVIDHRVLLFALGAAALSGLLCGAAPALSTAGAAIFDSLRDGLRSSGPRSSLRTAGSLVALQVAMALLLVTGAGLMVRTLLALRHVDPGFNPDGVLGIELSLPQSRYPERDQVLAFWDALLERLAGRPDILGAGTVGQLPLAGESWSSQFQAAGWPADRVGFEILHRRADAGYFAALEIPLVRGRMFEPSDRPDGPPVVLINQTFAAQHFPGEDPIGQRIAYDRAAGPDSIWYEIVGVVADQQQVSPGQAARAEVFENRNQDWGRSVWVVAKTRGEPLAAAPVVRQVVRELDPLLPITTVRPLREVWRASMAHESLILALLAGFGLVALVLATAGVYGVAAQAARQRIHEIGIRIALGAQSRDVLALLFRHGLTAIAVGTALGLAAALAGSRSLASLLFGVRPADPLTVVAVVALLAGTGAVATYLPARRACRTDAADTLRPT